MKENLYSELHKMYPVSKTLRFELKPQGKTLEHMKMDRILVNDNNRSVFFKDVKKLMDEYHKEFINSVLSKTKIKGLEEYKELFSKRIKLKDKKGKKSKTEKDADNKERKIIIKKMDEAEESFRKQIQEAFEKDSEYKGLFKKSLIENVLPTMLKSQRELAEVKEFEHFTTYFKGFNKNRLNIYSKDKKATSIGYRLIHENLAIFIKNLNVYEQVKNIIPKENLDECLKAMKEDNFKDDFDIVYSVHYFNKTLTQKGIDLYNKIIGGFAKENKEKVKGLNEYINNFNQLNKEHKLPIFNKLKKQILSDSEGYSFVLEKIEDDKELVETLKAYQDIFDHKILKKNNNDLGIINLFKQIRTFDLDKIYLEAGNQFSQINRISQELFEDWSCIKALIYDEYDDNYVGKKKKGSEEYFEERKKCIEKIHAYSIRHLEDLIQKRDSSISLIQYVKDFGETENGDLVETMENNYRLLNDILSREYENNSKKLITNDSEITLIKNYLDSLFKIKNFLTTFILSDKTIETDDTFHNELLEIEYDLSTLSRIYDKVRNYLKQKPYSTEKIKINFDTPTFLNGWDIANVKSNLGVILVKENQYFLAILKESNKKVLDVKTEAKSKDCYSKMEYKLIPDAKKMLPKVFVKSKKGKEKFNPSNELLGKYEKGNHKKGKDFDLQFLHELIDYFKKCLTIHEEWNKYHFEFKNTTNYEDISQFYKEVDEQAYKIEYKNIDADYIDSLVNDNKLYLFHIYNKDFSLNSKGTPNLHTMYWKTVFSESNLKDVVYKLSGGAEMFFRKSSLSLDKTPIHKANEKIENKNPLSSNKYSVFSYDLIKNRRFTVNKFQFHVPLTLNFKNKNINNINKFVNEKLKTLDNTYIIGIDRGERNLIYLSLIDSKGKIVEQFSLNEICNEYNGTQYKVDYHKLLDQKEKGRDEARKTWKEIDSIKELKDGYMSQVISKITQLMIKYNAIIVMEDLNVKFKESRKKREIQVYQKFEKKLNDKLNYLVMKKNNEFEEGGLLNAYQLSNKCSSFENSQKQSGIIFYIPPWNTSKIDPTTGFVQLFKFKYKSVEKSQEMFSKFDDILFNEKEKYYEFKMDYTKFTNKAYGEIKNWVLCSNGKRILTFRNKEKNNSWDSKEVVLVDEFKSLFQRFNIDKSALKESIVQQSDKAFFSELMHLMNLMLQLRNSKTGTSIDYLISCVRNSNGEFYNSLENKPGLPIDADANGAYNIARKGLMLIDQIKDSEIEDLGKIKFNITNQKWLEYAQTHFEL